MFFDFVILMLYYFYVVLLCDSDVIVSVMDDIIKVNV